MRSFEITGWRLSSLATAAEKYVLLLQNLSSCAGKLCLEAHFTDIEALKATASVVSSPRFSCYCWTLLGDSSDLRRCEFKTIRSARLLFNHQLITISPEIVLPPYDWGGEDSGLSNVVYAERHPEPVRREHREPNHQVALLCVEAAREGVGPNAGILERRVSSVMVTDYREHRYMVTVPTEYASQVAAAFGFRFKLRDGPGSLEFRGSPAELQAIQSQNRYSFESFPANCWSFNASAGKTPFSLERGSFLCPVLNIDSDVLPDAASVIDSLGKQVTACSVIRKYLAWRLADGTYSPHTQGNYLLLRRTQTGYVLSLGVEQYADADPTIAEVTSAAAPILDRLGVKLKAARGT